jgi:hypothetical protein
LGQVAQAFRQKPERLIVGELSTEQFRSPGEPDRELPINQKLLQRARLCEEFTAMYLEIGRKSDNLLPDRDAEVGSVEFSHQGAQGQSQFSFGADAEAFLLALPAGQSAPEITAYYQKDRDGILMGRRQGEAVVECLFAPNGTVTIFGEYDPAATWPVPQD